MTRERELAIQTLRARLQRRASPRAHMLLLVIITAAFGFGASALMLRAGLTSMAIRYPLATLLAYAAFLGLVSLWLRRYRLRARARRDDSGHYDLDILEIPFDAMWSGPSVPDDAPSFGGGGGFSGGGGGSSWGGNPVPASHVMMTPPPTSGSGGGGGGGFDLDLDEGALWLIPVLIIGAVALSVVIYMVYLAPALFAELLLDAGLATGLYRRLVRAERRSWLTTAVRNTIVPACFVAALLALAGTVMQGVYPDAVSIGVVARHLQEPRVTP